jgi:hypothetical protein
MRRIDIILLFIIIIAVVIIAAFIGAPNAIIGGSDFQTKFGNKDILKDLTKFPASKFESDCRAALESATKCKFPCVMPDWLSAPGRSSSADGARLELDGYCEELGLAFEAQGPQHTMFDKKYHKSYANYYRGLINDEHKRDICARHGVGLIIIDYKVPRPILRRYVLSRIRDFYEERRRAMQSGSVTLHRLNMEKIAPLIMGVEYAEPIVNEPYRNAIFEAELENMPKI